MLTIRDEQLRIFSRQSAGRFEDEMVGDVRDTYPDACSELSEPEIREIVQYGIEVAASYDVTAAHLVSDYIHLMFINGIDFDQDPRYPWAQEILADETLSEEKAMELLLDQAQASEREDIVDS